MGSSNANHACALGFKQMAWPSPTRSLRPEIWAGILGQTLFWVRIFDQNFELEFWSGILGRNFGFECGPEFLPK